MLREALEEALSRGERLRREITKDILNSQIFSDLANNPRFVKAVARVIRSKTEVAHSVQNRVKELLANMHIPTRQTVQDFERRVARLERDLNSVGRKLDRQTAKKTISGKKTTAKPSKADASAGNGHGTAVAGSGNGQAPEAQVS